MDSSTNELTNGTQQNGPAEITPTDFLRILRRQRWWILGVGGTVVLAVMVYTLLQAPVFEATTTLRVKEEDTSTLPVLDVLSELARGSKVETEIEIVRSRQVAEAVISELGLQATVQHPKRLPREAVLAHIQVARNAEEGEYNLTLQANGFKVSGPQGTVQGTYGRPARIGPLTVAPKPPTPGNQLSRIQLQVQPFLEAVSALQEDLRVTRPQREASIIAIAHQSTDPALARDVVNTAARHFLAFRNTMEKRRARSTVSFLRQQLDTLEVQLAQAEAELERFRQRNLVLQAETQVEENIRRLAELQARRSELEVERSALREVLSEVHAGDSTGGSWAEVASFPTFMQNEAISNILEQLTLLETERSRLEARRTPEDPDLRNLQSTIALLESRLESLARSYLAALNQQASSMDATLAEFDTQLEQVPAVEVQYARLLRNAEVLGELYTLLQTRLKEAEVAEAVEFANIQIVDPATRPIEPVKPRKLLNLLLGVLLGSALAVVVALLRESLDTRVRSREELAELGGFPILAAVPQIVAPNGRKEDEAQRIESRLVTHHSPRSPAAEAYRALRTNLTFSAAGGDAPLKRIVFTSPEPQDGKSTTAANTAITLAEQGYPTLLVECDLRRPMLHRVFREPRSPGLVDLLVGSASFEQVTHRIALPDYVEGVLDVITAGNEPPNPAELLGSNAMRSFLDDSVTRYEMVIFDTPPLNVVTDAAVVGRQADGIVVVTRHGVTRRDAVRLACDDLRRVKARVLGMVLNDLKAMDGSYRYHSYQRYYGYGE